MYIVPRGARDTFCLDFMQLGWLLAWVLHPEGAYHKRTWEDLPQSVRKDQFLSDLLNCGQYSQAKLMESTVICDADIFESRDIRSWTWVHFSCCSQLTDEPTPVNPRRPTYPVLTLPTLSYTRFFYRPTLSYLILPHFLVLQDPPAILPCPTLSYTILPVRLPYLPSYPVLL